MPTNRDYFKVEKFVAPISVRQCYNCQNFGHSAKNCKAKIKCVICEEGLSHKGCPNREKSSQDVLIAKDYVLLTIKAVLLIENSYASILKQTSALPSQPKGDTFSFTADQSVKFVATVAIQIAQPQVCYINDTKDEVDKKSSLC